MKAADHGIVIEARPWLAYQPSTSKSLPHRQASVKRDQVRRGFREVQLGHLQAHLLCDVAGIQPERAEFHLPGIGSSLMQPSDITWNPANAEHGR